MFRIYLASSSTVLPTVSNKLGWLESNADFAWEAWDALEVVESGRVHRVECRSLVSVEMLENEILNDGERNNTIQCPNHIFAHAIIDTQMEGSDNPDPEPSVLHIDNEWSRENKSYQVPEYVGIPADQSFSKECHQERRRLNAK